jgi:hypothetical protein
MASRADFKEGVRVLCLLDEQQQQKANNGRSLLLRQNTLLLSEVSAALLSFPNVKERFIKELSIPKRRSCSGS